MYSSNSNKMRVLITTPRLYKKGGVAGYYNVIKKYLTINYALFEVGSLDSTQKYKEVFRIFNDIKNFRKVLKKNKFDLVHINPSFHFKSLIRDAVFLIIAKKNDIPIITFFHGWDINHEKKIEHYFKPLFKKVYNLTDAFIVLSSQFKNKLRIWGFKQPIYVEFNPIDDELLVEFDINKMVEVRIQKNKINILFLARIIKEKGIIETLLTIKELQSQKMSVSLIIAGDGPYLNEAKQLAQKLDIKNCNFLGYIQGEQKREVFKNSNLYIFPSYGEGLPLSLLEAMAFGLPVVTRPVGGIKDFFEEGKHGFLSESKDPKVFADLIKKILEDENLYRSMSLYNYQYAQENFLASKVAKKLEKIYKEICS